MPIRYKNPLAGKPYTSTFETAGGRKGYKVLPYELTPLCAMIVDKVSVFAATLFAILLAVKAFQSSGTSYGIEHALTFLGFVLVVYVATREFLRGALRKPSRIVFHDQTIAVGLWPFREFYDRNIEHSFALIQHDEADTEQRLASQKQKPYFRDSYHVILMYAGQRNDVLTVYGRKEAIAILQRLIYCDRALNDDTNMPGGHKPTPELEWKQAPGGLGGR